MANHRFEIPRAPSARPRLPAVVFALSLTFVPDAASAQEILSDATRRHAATLCFDCHSADHAEAGVNLKKLMSRGDFAQDFRAWRKVVRVLEQRQMPPEQAPQPDGRQRTNLLTAVTSGLHRAAERYDGDPGQVIIRRLTSAEYNWSVRDLTGLDLNLEQDVPQDAVGGEGFSNTGLTQFTQDSTVERYLEVANRVARHAVIGAGPLTFYQDPGQTGFELSAISRIQDIYSQHGFRTAAGEGGEAFGLKKYPRAFLACWKFRHRQRLRLSANTLTDLAIAEQLDVRFVEYIHRILTDDSHSFPTSEIVSGWQQLPEPDGTPDTDEASIRARCDDLFRMMFDWQTRFGQNRDAKEEAPVLAEDAFDVAVSQPFEMNVNWPKGTTTAHIQLQVESANRDGRPNAVVIWRNPMIQFRVPDKRLKDPGPLSDVISTDDVGRLGFGSHPQGGTVDDNDFVTVGTQPLLFEIPIPDDATSARLFVDAELDFTRGDDCIVRCTMTQSEETDQGKSVSALLANTGSDRFADWKHGVLEFARVLPQVSQREPAPSDRDPIPAPFDATYNNSERNHFHYKIKYFRDDRFLVDNIIDASTRKRLDLAWTDLLGSFEYHDSYLRFVAGKYDLDLGGRGIAELDSARIDRVAPEARTFVRRLHREYQSIQDDFRRAEAGHVNDLVEFAGLAWRRRPDADQELRLRSYYDELRSTGGLDHPAAIRACLVRILVAPEFLFRAEAEPAAGEAGPLDDRELASRLSFFLWSSVPDRELRRAAAAGELRDMDQLARQARRMLRDPKARRFATEFFGQWLGFYRFDRYRGVDPKRFPEFTDTLKTAMYDEAIAFFHHIVSRDRPLNEILTANYTFLNQSLAEHYGIDRALSSVEKPLLVRGVNASHRGGLLSLGAVLTATSAPLRTSPVKRGDWVLRRILGTPVPPPPADAGSISPDDVTADGLTILQRLEAHRRDASCVNCHSRIDALGFAMEQYDPLGRWREKYRDGTQIQTSGTLRDGTPIAGMESLRDYLVAHREQFHRTLCTRLLGYALGRSEAIGDTRVLEDMAAKLGDGSGMSTLVEQIVTSRQFRFHGGLADRVER